MSKAVVDARQTNRGNDLMFTKSSSSAQAFVGEQCRVNLRLRESLDSFVLGISARQVLVKWWGSKLETGSR